MTDAEVAELKTACLNSMNLLEDMAHAYFDLLNARPQSDPSDDPLLARLRHLRRPQCIQDMETD
jgi:hypothetical protein